MHKLIIVSFDAMIADDLDTLVKYPTFRDMMENGCRVQHLQSIYPSLTYPCHVTMATGCYPDKTGVYSNEKRIVGVKSIPWNFDHCIVKTDDIMDAAKHGGLTTASVGWPVSGNHKSVDYLLDEAWPEGRDKSSSAFRKAYLDTGTPAELFDEIVAPKLWMRVKRAQPDSSYFLSRISCDIIRRYQPDLLMMHVGNPDHERHVHGVHSKAAADCLIEAETIMHSLMIAAKEAGVYEQTNFVATSDHGQLDTVRAVRPNVLLAKNGFIRLNADGSVKDWDAWCYPIGLSAQIVLRDLADSELRERVGNMLNHYCNEGVWGFSRVYTAEEAVREHLAGDFSFVLETDGYSSFDVGWTGPYTSNHPMDECGNCRRGSHGHHPDKGPSPVFIGFGPAFKAGAVLSNANLVDGAPTYAKILGVSLPDADGHPLEELLDLNCH